MEFDIKTTVLFALALQKWNRGYKFNKIFTVPIWRNLQNSDEFKELNKLRDIAYSLIGLNMCSHYTMKQIFSNAKGN